ncbi:MAG: hypothetical protein JSV46_03210, partial [Candidatus Aminicenantes bacterium]
IAVMLNAAVIGTLIIYAAIIEVMRGQLAPFQGLSEGLDSNVLRYVFYGIAIINIFIIRLLRRGLLRKPPSDKQELFCPILLRASIITAAFCEIPAILGFCLFLLIGSVRDYYQLAGVSFIMVFLHFPRYGIWKDWIKNKTHSITSCE